MDPARPNDSATEKETGRLEAFSDGVFSIAMTLLVLELKVPTLSGPVTGAWLCGQLAKQWPSYFAFTTSFFTVLIMWINHHGIFKLVRKIDALLLFTNGLLLLMVTVVPFPTALVASYLRTPAASTACAVYAGTFVIISVAYGLLLLAARRGGRLLIHGAAGEVSRRVKDCFCIGVPLYLLAALVAPWSRWLSLGICTALWVFWSVGSLERGPAFRR
jgi:uncharacterized membrane protein